MTSNNPRKPSLYVITEMSVAISTTLLPLDIAFGAIDQTTAFRLLHIFQRRITDLYQRKLPTEL